MPTRLTTRLAPVATFAALASACGTVAEMPLADADGLDAPNTLELSTEQTFAILAFVNGADATLSILDDDVGLDSRAARNIFNRTRGGDALFGTGDDRPCATLAELDAVPYVGTSTFAKLADYVERTGRVPALLVEGVAFTASEGAAVVVLANSATVGTLDVDVGLDRRAAEGLVARRPHPSLTSVAASPYVGGTALRALREYVASGGPDSPGPDPTGAPAPADVALYDGLSAGQATPGSLDASLRAAGHILAARRGAKLTVRAQANTALRLWVFGPADRASFANAPLLANGTGVSATAVFEAPADGHYLAVVSATPTAALPYTLSLGCVGEACAAYSIAGAPCPQSFVADALGCMASVAADPDAGATTPHDLASLCVDAEPLADAYDSSCTAAGRAVFCGQSYADAWMELQSNCADAAFFGWLAKDCQLGARFADLLTFERLVVTGERRITSATGLSQLERNQIISAVHASSHTEVTTAAQAIAVVDEQFIRRLDLADLAHRRFTAYEYGAGDNSYGRVFVAGSLDSAARIQDGDLVDCAPSPDQAGAPCTTNAACGSLTCVGAASGQGRCASTGDIVGESESCGAGTNQGCAAGLFCAGLSESTTGLCVAPWMVRTFTGTPLVSITDGPNGSVEIPITVGGLATVDMDVRLEVVVRHPNNRQLTVTLENPASTIATVFSGATQGDGGADLDTEVVLRDFPGDEGVNGVWKLRVQDTAAGGLGVVESYRLFVSSRFD